MERMLCTIKWDSAKPTDNLMRIKMHPRLSRELLLLLLSGLGLSVHGGKIINGEKVREGEMPFMASLQNADHSHICGGFLISEDIVLTAAHCEEDGHNMLKSVVLGTRDLENIDDTTMRYEIETKYKHESYDDDTLVNDIMLLKLSRKVQLEKQRVEMIRLPQKEVQMTNCDTCQVAGWGITRQCPCSVHHLRKADVRFLNLNKCRRTWREHLPDTVMCAGGFTQDGKGACLGDSGGPLICNGEAVGIVSFNADEECDFPNLPDVYTNLSKYIDWIDETKNKI